MKPRCLALLVALLALAAPVTPARASDVAMELTRQYAHYLQAFMTHNIRAIEAQYLPGWSGRSHGQIISRSQMLALTRQSMDKADPEGERCITISRLSVRKNVATAVVNHIATERTGDAQGRKHVIRTVDTARDTWVRTGGAWKLQRSELLFSRMTRDGKPYLPDAVQPSL